MGRFWEDVAPRLQQSPLYKPLVRAAPPLITREQLGSAIERAEALPLYVSFDPEPIGLVRRAHKEDTSLAALVLLENLCCKVSAALAIREIFLRNSHLKANRVQYILSCSEEAVGDRYQRGGGNLAKAIAEFSGCDLAAGSDIKNFCAAPVPATP